MSVSQAFQPAINRTIDADLQEKGFVATAWRTERKPAAPAVEQEHDHLDVTENTRVGIRISDYSYASIHISLADADSEEAVFALDRDARRAAVLRLALAEMELALPRLRAIVATLDSGKDCPAADEAASAQPTSDLSDQAFSGPAPPIAF